MRESSGKGHERTRRDRKKRSSIDDTCHITNPMVLQKGESIRDDALKLLEIHPIIYHEDLTKIGWKYGSARNRLNKMVSKGDLIRAGTGCFAHPRSIIGEYIRGMTKVRKPYSSFLEDLIEKTHVEESDFTVHSLDVECCDDKCWYWVVKHRKGWTPIAKGFMRDFDRGDDRSIKMQVSSFKVEFDIKASSNPFSPDELLSLGLELERLLRRFHSKCRLHDLIYIKHHYGKDSKEFQFKSSFNFTFYDFAGGLLRVYYKRESRVLRFEKDETIRKPYLQQVVQKVVDPNYTVKEELSNTRRDLDGLIKGVIDQLNILTQGQVTIQQLIKKTLNSQILLNAKISDSLDKESKREKSDNRPRRFRKYGDYVA